MINRYYLLDISRGIAALIVVIFHYRIFYHEPISDSLFNIDQSPFSNYLYIFYKNGWLAVQFFFILSGFIFYELYLEKIRSKKISFKNFFVLRFSRLYPLHLITLLITVIMIFFFDIFNVKSFNIEADIYHFFLNIFLIHYWGFEQYQSFNEPSWSISIEIMCYLIFFIIFSFRLNKFFITICLLIISGVIYKFNVFISYGLYCFFMGGMTNLIFKKIDTTKFLNIFFILFLISLVVLYQVNNSIFEKIILLTICLPLVIIIFASIQKKNKDIGKKLKFLGDISYSIYLNHFVLQLMVHLFLSILNLKVNFNSEIIFIFYIIFIILSSSFTYYYIENNLKNFIRKKLINDKKI